MDDFLDRYQVPKLNPKEIEAFIKILLTKKVQSQMALVQNSIRPSKKT